MNLINTLFAEAFGFHTQGDLVKAELLYKQILGINPNNFDVLFLLASLLSDKNLPKEAIKLLKKAISVAPENPLSYNLLGNIYCKLGAHLDALATYDSAIQIDPNNAEIYHAKGLTLSALMRDNEALEAFQEAINLDQGLKVAYSAQGYILHTQNYLNEALLKYQQAAVIQPTDPLDFFNIAVILQEQKRYVDALEAYEKVIALDPTSIDALNNMGLIYSALDQLNIAIKYHKQAIVINPTHPNSYNNLGYLHHELMQLDDALLNYEKAITLAPDYIDARWNRASVLLTQGDYPNGFVEYEWRLKLHDVRPRKLLCKRWNGDQDLKGKTILIYGEQGLGDVIQFARYLTLVNGLGAKVIFEVQLPLLHLFEDLASNIKTIPQGSPLPPIDFECPIMSLALCLKTTLKSIPNPEGYLRPKQHLVNNWSKRFDKRKKPRIGIVWSSVSNYPDDRKRSMSLETFLKCLPDKGFEYVCLQKIIKDDDLATLKSNPHIQFYGDELTSFQDTAALIECVDLVLSTCTSIPHLSGALGKPTWIILPFKPDWRWLTQREDSPWYNKTKLYRQESPKGWNGVLSRVRNDLLELITVSAHCK
jgi:tetratricopeptide (TPR) repeat protein